MRCRADMHGPRALHSSLAAADNEAESAEPMRLAPIAIAASARPMSLFGHSVNKAFCVQMSLNMMTR